MTKHDYIRGLAAEERFWRLMVYLFGAAVIGLALYVIGGGLLRSYSMLVWIDQGSWVLMAAGIAWFPWSTHKMVLRQLLEMMDQPD